MKRSLRHATALMITLAAVAFAALPAPSLADELPPEAQAAFNKGVLAARQQEWDIAISGFEEARRSAPKSPEIFYNLGLAESKIPGRELRAIAWFGAYLAALPSASNAPAVEEFIASLEVKSESNARRLVEAAQDAARLELKNDPSELQDMNAIAQMWASLGDMPRAMASADLAESEIPDSQLQVLGHVASGQAFAGDFTGALQTVDIIRARGGGTDEPLDDIAETQAHEGDIAAALRNANLITGFTRKYAYYAIATAQAAAGDIAGALETANVVLEGRVECLSSIAAVQAWRGDVPGALKTAELISDPAVKEPLVKTIRDFQQNPASNLRAFAPQFKRYDGLSDWLDRLDDAKSIDGSFALNTEPFLNLAGYIKSLPSKKTGAETATYNLVPAAQTLVGAQIQIERLVREERSASDSTRTK